jgi:hypothetical protein
MRKLVRLIKKDPVLAAQLRNLLIQEGYPADTFLIIQHSALSSKTLFHKAKRPKKVYSLGDKKLAEILQKVRYNYSKKWMEKFF